MADADMCSGVLEKEEDGVAKEKEEDGEAKEEASEVVFEKADVDVADADKEADMCSGVLEKKRRRTKAR